MSLDPTETDPDHYKVIFENERVRVLEYTDHPGDSTSWHGHPDTFMYPLGSFRRRISAGGQQVEAELQAGQPRWVSAQEHSGENTGDTDSHAIFVELKEPAPTAATATDSRLGPDPGQA
ncbi:MAG: cytoplasmic protein [Actinomycetota bacterium]|nr:cytoplasmic protein [Actinomycetota bacterium]